MVWSGRPKTPLRGADLDVPETRTQKVRVRGGEADFRTHGSLMCAPGLASHLEFESALPSNSFEPTSGGIPPGPVRDPTLELRPQRRLSKCRRKPLDETASSVILMAETPPHGVDFGGAGDAFADPRGAWRCGQIRANQSPRANSR